MNTMHPKQQLVSTPTWKIRLQRAIRRTGYRLERARGPVVIGSQSIHGSFPPVEEWNACGLPEDYFVHAGYSARADPIPYSDHDNDDEWQEEVYRFAHELVMSEHLRSVCDIGCGSGFKLLKYFGGLATIGLDTASAVARLMGRYPGRDWAECDFSNSLPFRPDLVISADVIEHLPDPDLLLDYIVHLRPSWVILSTPDRNLLRQSTHSGPPLNPCHVREWNMLEFRRYVDSRLKVVEHFVSNAGQCTQCVLARCRP